MEFDVVQTDQRHQTDQTSQSNFCEDNLVVKLLTGPYKRFQYQEDIMDQNPRRRYRKDDDDLFDDNPDEDSYYYNDQYENDPDLEENEVTPLPVESISPPLTTDNETLAQIVIIPKVVAYKPGVGKSNL